MARIFGEAVEVPESYSTRQNHIKDKAKQRQEVNTVIVFIASIPNSHQFAHVEMHAVAYGALPREIGKDQCFDDRSAVVNHRNATNISTHER